MKQVDKLKQLPLHKLKRMLMATEAVKKSYLEGSTSMCYFCRTYHACKGCPWLILQGIPCSKWKGRCGAERGEEILPWMSIRAINIFPDYNMERRKKARKARLQMINRWIGYMKQAIKEKGDE